MYRKIFVDQVFSHHIELNADDPLEKALQLMQNAGVHYAVVKEENDELKVISRNQLVYAGDKKTLTGKSFPNAIIIGPKEILEDIVKIYSKELQNDPDLCGLLIQNNQGRHIGVLPREYVLDYDRFLNQRRGVDRLEGDSLDILYFECPDGHERRKVSYYDPNNHPVCSCGRAMRPVE